MAVVQKLATGLPDKTVAKPERADVRQQHGVLRTSCFVADIANGDSATSTIVVARLPSHARIHRASAIHHGAITGLTDVDIGVAEAPACIVDGVSLATAGTKPGASGIAIADLHKPLWQLAGLSADPQREVEVLMTLNVDAGAAGTAAVDLVYVTE